MLYLKHLSGQGKIKLSQGILKTTSGNPVWVPGLIPGRVVTFISLISVIHYNKY